MEELILSEAEKEIEKRRFSQLKRRHIGAFFFALENPRLDRGFRLALAIIT